MLSWAALKAVRCSELRLVRPTVTIAIARSRTAIGNPQNSRVAKLIVIDAAGDSGPDLPGVTIRQTSPAMIISALSQNSGCPVTSVSSRRLAAATASTTTPAAVTSVMSIHSGEPGRGLIFRVSLGSFMTSSRASRIGGGDRYVTDSGCSVLAKPYLAQPNAHYLLLVGS